MKVTLGRKNLLQASRPKPKVAKALAPPVPISEGDYQARNDFRTLEEAHGIKSDPKRHKAALAHGKAKAEGIANVLQGASKQNADPQAKGTVYYSTGK